VTGSRGPSFLVSLAVLLLAAGCASTVPLKSELVTPVAQRAPVPVKGGSAPVEFGKLLLKLPAENTIGTVQGGRSCVGQAPLTWKSGRGSSVGELFGQLLLGELAAAGYTVVGDPDELFEDSRSGRAEYVIAGVIRDVKANVCHTRSGDGRGEASLAVDWQVYSHRTKAVELKATTEGSGKAPSARGAGGAEAITEAFVSATRNLMAEAKFHTLIAGAGQKDAKASASPLPIPVAFKLARAVAAASVESMVSESRMGVVTVFVGNTMGSGFLISPDGYLLTNEHVVEDARYVKVKFVTGREAQGEVVRVDRSRDVALVKLETDVYRPLALGDSGRVAPGSEVFAIGTPLDEERGQTVTKGILSGYGDDEGQRILRSDVAVHEGNSGGPLLDRSGAVVGMCVSGFLLMPAGVGVGLNSFIPIEDALAALRIHSDSGEAAGRARSGGPAPSSR
jgi:serine protease Do